VPVPTGPGTLDGPRRMHRPAQLGAT